MKGKFWWRYNVSTAVSNAYWHNKNEFKPHNAFHYFPGSWEISSSQSIKIGRYAVKYTSQNKRYLILHVPRRSGIINAG